MRRNMSGETKVKYKKMNRNKDDFLDIQFQKPPPKFPTKAIALATTLFVVGSVLLVVGSLLMTGYIDAKYGDRTWPVLILGSIMFIPGFYHVRIAYYAYKGYAGFSYEDIPEFE
ncbi:transmembrane protein 230-like [Mercenaria mercenaria]|uniref:transmembrane protein 230-like n=1 Tax=Mercenaria mercenaria TaxID=6596 RepID=UPI00234F7FCB|nr:transmembrane protein 230-like [Mercenaria mercenaria]